MPGLRDLKTRIKSVQSMRKVTRAMQMVSAAKMRKAQAAVLASRTYASLAWELISKLTASDVIPDATSGSENDPESRYRSTILLKSYPKAKKIGVVILGSNRGLVGSLNSNLTRAIQTVVADKSADYKNEIISEVVVYGKKAKAVAQRMRETIVADFTKSEKPITTQDIYPLAKYITDSYATGEYEKIVLVYNKFVSTLVQKPEAKQLLPFNEEQAADSGQDGALSTQHSALSTSNDFIFEPSPELVLNHLIPRIIESQIYQAVLESDASEHSARMVMMKNATEAAGDLISDYQLTYNQLRQGKITTELAEITAGRIALE